VNEVQKKLLLIEDDRFMRDMITMVLSTENYDVSGADSGAAALQLCSERGDYDAVISDMYLPDTDGLTLFAQMNALFPGRRFIILTSETDETIRRKASELGIIYVLKDAHFAETVLNALEK